MSLAQNDLSRLVLLSDQTVAGVASIKFAAPTYSDFLCLWDLTCDTPLSQLLAQFSTDGGATLLATNYLGALTGADSGAAGFALAGPATGAILSTAGGAAFNPDYTGQFYASRMNVAATASARVNGQSVALRATTPITVHGFGLRTTAANYNGLGLISTAGLLTGRARLYGLR